MCSFIGAQAQIDTSASGGRNPLVELAQAIDILRAPDEAERALEAMRGPKVADSPEQDPRLAGDLSDPVQAAQDRNAAGSFEAFSFMFGATVSPPGETG